MGATRLAILLLCVTGAVGGACDQPNQQGNNCGSVTVAPTNIHNSSIISQVVTHVLTQITMPNGTITTIVNTINYVGNSSDRIILLQNAGNTSDVHTIYANIVIQSYNGSLIVLVILIICLAVLKEITPWLKNRCARRQPASAVVDPVDMTAIEVKA